MRGLDLDQKAKAGLRRPAAILLKHYKGLATREEAEQFYALRPNITDANFTAIGRRLDEANLREMSSRDS